MCDWVAHDRLQLDYKDDESSIVYRAIPDDATIKKLEALGATINFIDIWLIFLRENFDARCETYINAMKLIFRKIPQTIKIALLSIYHPPPIYAMSFWTFCFGVSAFSIVWGICLNIYFIALIYAGYLVFFS